MNKHGFELSKSIDLVDLVNDNSVSFEKFDEILRHYEMQDDKMEAEETCGEIRDSYPVILNHGLPIVDMNTILGLATGRDLANKATEFRHPPAFQKDLRSLENWTEDSVDDSVEDQTDNEQCHILTNGSSMKEQTKRQNRLFGVHAESSTEGIGQRSETIPTANLEPEVPITRSSAKACVNTEINVVLVNIGSRRNGSIDDIERSSIIPPKSSEVGKLLQRSKSKESLIINREMHSRNFLSFPEAYPSDTSNHEDPDHFYEPPIKKIKSSFGVS